MTKSSGRTPSEEGMISFRLDTPYLAISWTLCRKAMVTSARRQIPAARLVISSIKLSHNSKNAKEDSTSFAEEHANSYFSLDQASIPSLDVDPDTQLLNARLEGGFGIAIDVLFSFAAMRCSTVFHHTVLSSLLRSGGSSGIIRVGKGYLIKCSVILAMRFARLWNPSSFLLLVLFVMKRFSFSTEVSRCVTKAMHSTKSSKTEPCVGNSSTILSKLGKCIPNKPLISVQRSAVFLKAGEMDDKIVRIKRTWLAR
mmetsp:Transcript_4719/g.6916  ORF Transcript_4719/g.6916 Transcript_4719/m.6916 type:complete len:255 (+) Transcript_4719:476-1240(+)